MAGTVDAAGGVGLARARRWAARRERGAEAPAGRLLQPGCPLGAAAQARVRPLGAGVYLQGTQAVNRRPHIHQARTHQKRGVSLTQGVQSDVVEPLSHLRKCLR